jgi:hypothetical protein
LDGLSGGIDSLESIPSLLRSLKIPSLYMNLNLACLVVERKTEGGGREGRKEGDRGREERGGGRGSE